MYLRPKISILIPCYNHESYIVSCIESVVKSCSSEVEVIFCDDASSDDSYEVAMGVLIRLSGLLDRFSFKALRNIKNVGVCKTLNRCIAEVESEYIYLIASDDYLKKDALDFAFDALLQSKGDAIISDCGVVDENSNLTFESAIFGLRRSNMHMLKCGEIVSEFVMNWTVPGPSLIMKRSVYDEIGLYDESIVVEDRDFYLRLLASSKVIFRFEPIAFYRVHSKNTFSQVRLADSMYREFSEVNFKNSNNYRGVNRFYLKTYWLDLFLPRMLSLFPKAIRRAIYYVVVLKVRVRLSVR